MAEYIEREAVYNTLKAMYCDECTDEKCQMCEYAYIMFVLDNLPIADVQPVDRWISVNDRLPLIEHLYSSMTCICCTKKGSVLPLRYVCTLVRKKKVYRWELMNGSLWGDDVAYWQPLPEPPKATKG